MPLYAYPSITGQVVGGHMVVTPKYDGSNVRAKWSAKSKGFELFGARKILLDESTDPLLSRSIPLWRERYEELVTWALKRAGVVRAVVFGEFYGPSSFAGYHDPEDVFEVIMYDLAIDDQLVGQREFRRMFKGAEAELAPVLYEGPVGPQIIAQVKAGTFPGQTFEGVVCKGRPSNAQHTPPMFKVKSDGWIERVKARYGDDPAKLKELL